MIIIETTAVTTKDERTAVHAVRFSHPSLNPPAHRWTGVPLEPADSHECAPVLFIAPALLADAPHHEPPDRRPSRHTRSTRTTS